MKKKIHISSNQLRQRSFIITICFTLILCILCGRVGYIQFVNGAEYKKLAAAQQTKTRAITAKRGTIYDRNGNTLAISATAYRVSINPRDIKNDKNFKDDVAGHQRNVAQKLSDILKLDYTTVYNKVMEKNAYQELKRKIEDAEIKKLREWIKDENIFGIYIDEDAKRYYPNNTLAAHIIGFTGVDDQGLAGIESIYDEYLKGKNGYVLTEVDGAQHVLPMAEEVRIEPLNGNNIKLTIDETIQYLTEKSLEKEIENCNVLRGAACIVMNPKTGEILASASNPSFDLNAPFAFPKGVNAEKLGIDEDSWTGRSTADVKILNETVWRNKVISDSYEPGSTFKAITSSALIEEKIVTKDTVVSDADYKIGGRTIHCWRAATHGSETFHQAVCNSCNPVFAKYAVQLGIDKYYKYIDAFGFNNKTGINFPGEAKSIFHKDPKEIDLAVTAFGQRFQITPLQLATAYCAIANGGELLVPQLVKEITDSQGNIIKKFEKETIRQVVSAETCKTVLEMLEGVVNEGTGSNAYVKGLRIAGKTGTSQTLTTEIDGRYIISFCGIAPSDNPEIVCLYILDHPDLENNTGGAHAAPAAGKLMEDILNYMKVEKLYSDKDDVEIAKTKVIPYIVEKNAASAKSALEKQGLKIRLIGDSTSDEAIIVSQTPAAGFSVPEGSTIIAYTSDAVEAQTVTVPNLINMTVIDAYKKLSDNNLCMKLNGKGKVAAQSPPAGTKVPIGEIVTVDFRVINEGAE